MLKSVSHDVGPDRHLLICCKAFSGKTDQFSNLTVRRIPQSVLANCEWGRDDYSLRIATLPKTESLLEEEAPGDEPAPATKRGRRKMASAVPDLFNAPVQVEA